VQNYVSISIKKNVFALFHAKRAKDFYRGGFEDANAAGDEYQIGFFRYM
jgi:hypothetical protein